VQVVKGNSNVVSAQQGTDVLNGQTAGHGNGYVGSYNGNSNENNQQYVNGNGNSVVGTLYAPATGVRAANLCPAASSPAPPAHDEGPSRSTSPCAVGTCVA